MRICLYYRTIDKPWGGANSFIVNLRNFFMKNDVEITTDINSQYDVLFLNGAYKAPGKMFDLSSIRAIKRYGYASFIKRIFGQKRKVKIVYRLDGLRKIYAGVNSKMDTIQLQCLPYADHIIFQSKFAHQIFSDAGYNGNNFSVIHNGVNTNMFNIAGRDFWDGKYPLKIVACSWSANPAKGHAIIARYADVEGVEVHYVGKWPQNISSGKVICHGPLPQREIAEIFKQSHVFLFPALQEACSNTLLEALACGLPVLYIDSGSNREIAGEYGIELREESFERSITYMREQYGLLRARIENENKKFSIGCVGEKYLEICQKLCHGSDS
ncbi:MAG: glycosyltransferase [Candidatus Omnitrophica bacterium]|nr:glycosyltransferase [Candidatus Omnitrophota bacterium]